MILVIFFLLASPFVTAAAGYAAETLPQGDFSELRQTGTGTVGQVIDPMTVRMNDGKIVTLAGLDIPDFGVHRTGVYAQTALKILNDMLVGNPVYIYQTKNEEWGRVNRMERQIVHLQRKSDGAWVQGTLIGLGLARVMTTQRNPEMAAQMYALEQQARAEKAGVWESAEYGILTPEELTDKTASFQIVEGTIQSTGLNKNRIYLNFGDKWQEDFTVSIAPGDKRLFQEAGIDLMKLGGQSVRVRGWVRSYNGPYMEIDHAEALEFIDSAHP